MAPGVTVKSLPPKWGRRVDLETLLEICASESEITWGRSGPRDGNRFHRRRTCSIIQRLQTTLHDSSTL